MPSSPRSGLNERLLAVALGALSAVVLLEIGLRLVGAGFLRLQEHHNRLTLQHPGAYRVLCIGDSMTARTYPFDLEEILNSRGEGRRFAVIDKARPGTTSRDITATLPLHLAKYHPDMVVVMMGSNDYGETLLYGGLPASGGYSLKTLRLAGFLRYLVAQRWSRRTHPAPTPETPAPSSPDSNSVTNRPTPQKAISRALTLRRFPKAPRQVDCFSLPQQNPQPDDPLLVLGWNKQALGRFKAAEDDFRKAMRLKPQESWPYRDLGLLYIREKRTLAATRSFEAAAARGGDNIDLYACLGTQYLQLHDYAKAEQAFQHAVALDPDSTIAYGGLATCYGATGRAELEREALGKANALRERRYVALTRDNYRRVRQLVKDSGALLVCVQYPRRGVKEIKNLFDDPAGILFVDNEGPFNLALSAAPPTDYFVDFFGGDFGHCTKKGYRLLAEDIAQVILKAISRP